MRVLPAGAAAASGTAHDAHVYEVATTGPTVCPSDCNNSSNKRTSCRPEDLQRRNETHLMLSRSACQASKHRQRRRRTSQCSSLLRTHRARQALPPKLQRANNTICVQGAQVKHLLTQYTINRCVYVRAIPKQRQACSCMEWREQSTATTLEARCKTVRARECVYLQATACQAGQIETACAWCTAHI